MRFINRVGLRATASQQRRLGGLGVKISSVIGFPGEEDPLVSFEIAEDDPKWPLVRALLQQWGKDDWPVITEFSQQEIEAARWLRLMASSHHGYPQPDEDFSYLHVTYDPSDYCDPCGSGAKQKAPFRMKGEPRWGRRGILQMNWVFDEYFVKPEVWSNVFKPHGIPFRPVTNRSGVELKTVVQLVVEEEVGIVVEGLDFERCMKCGRVKYLPFTRGAFPALTATPSHAMVKTREYFGSGTSAHKEVLVSQELARSLDAAKIRGASFWPVRMLSC